MATLSVVVPFFNVEQYIGAALESIARQTLRDIEVIMVDDGSVDGSTLVAKSFAARDPRFRLVYQPNQGLGPARNTGVRYATGKYLAFADSDDLLDPHAYELLAGSLGKTGSDIACGGVRRLNRLGASISWLHEEPFRQTLRRTHVSRFPALMQDRTAWNKVFLRSFWDAHGLRFPGTLYEDGPVMIRAHVLASAVDVLRDVVYYWRVRDSGGLSITQRARDLSNIEDRMTSVRSVGGFLASTAPRLKLIYDQSVLNVDLAMLVSAYELANDAERKRLTELAAQYLDTVDDSVFQRVHAIRRLHYYLIRRGMYPELLEVLRYWRSEVWPNAGVVRSGGRRPRWYVTYPYFRDPAKNVPDEVYDVTDEMTLIAQVDAVTWRAGRLRVEGFAYVRRLSSATPDECRIRATLRNARLRRTIRLPVQRVHRPDVTARSNQAAACYDWSGFAIEVNPKRLAAVPGVWRSASWELRIEVAGQGLRREGPIEAVAPGSAQWPEGRWISPRVWIQPAPEHDGRFFVRGRRVGAMVASCRPAAGAIEIEGWTTAELGPDAALVVSPRTGGGAPVRVPAEAAGLPASGTARRRDRRTGFRARIPAARLAREAKGASAIDLAIHIHDEVTWDVSLKAGDGPPRRLGIAPGAAGARAREGEREITGFVTHFGYLSILERTVRPTVTQVEWTGDERLILRGGYTDEATRPAELWLRHGDFQDQYVVPLTWEHLAFTAELAPGRMPGIAGELPLASGNWNLHASRGNGREVTVAAARALLPGLPGRHRAGNQEIELQPYRTDALRLNVRPAFASDEEERGRYAKRGLVEHYYPQVMRRPLRDLAVFDSFGGLQYSCNPRAIHDELRRSHPELECVWVTKDNQFNVPDGTQVVLADSRAHFESLAQARFIVTNNMLPEWYRKRDGQFCLQTWHGTPLKRIGLEIEQPKFSNAVVYKDLLRENVASWDLLLSQNAFSTPVFRRAFGPDVQIAESGYPRNDLLHRADRAERAAAVRRQLGLAADTRVVLYAPTWRDDAFQQNGRYRFELELDLQRVSRALGDHHVLLLRLHSNVRNSQEARGAGARVADVTSYPDIAGLFLVSDVLITDYSSAMFDFAGTGRPMLFFAYDLERYRDQLRGFYFDFEEQAPGPLLRTGGDVIEALRDIDRVHRSYQQKYAAFTASFCALDDGHAAARAVDRLLGGR